MLYVQVTLLQGFREALWYSVNDSMPGPLLHALVHVPLKNKIIPAYVIRESRTKPNVSFDLRPIHAIEQFPADTYYEPFIAQLAAYYIIEPRDILQRITFFVHSKQTEEVAHMPTNNINAPIQLTTQQEHIYQKISPYIIQPKYAPVVIHGVTGSGKTEIYIQLIIDTCKQGKTSILLLPEVTLAIAFEARLKQRLANISIFSFHSATPPAEKRTLWHHLVSGKPILIIGVHLPIMLPIQNLGLIIVDEEHETGYQEKRHPHINSKHAALMRAQLLGIPIILGSATPSLATLYQVKTKKWKFFQLTERFAGSFPRITIVSLTDKKKRKHFWISDILHAAIAQRLEKKEQTILFINRRGHSFFVQCGACSFIFKCINCSVSLTLHQNDLLQCHYCGYNKNMPVSCSECQAHESTFIKKGIGTQKLVQLVAQLFPHARIARADLDTSSKRKAWQKTVEDMQQGNIDILIGTQTITKGYDFPRVTLVGILWADLNLHFPCYNASETTLQQLIQVAGRAGRHRTQSDVIVQAMGNHTIFQYMDEKQYLSFYAPEMEARQLTGYPPHKHLCVVEIKHQNEQTVDKEAHTVAYHLQTLRTQHHHETIILGPSFPPVHTIQKMHMRHIHLKAEYVQNIHMLLHAIDKKKYKSAIVWILN